MKLTYYVLHLYLIYKCIFQYHLQMQQMLLRRVRILC